MNCTFLMNAPLTRAYGELEDIQAGVGKASPEGDLQTPDIAANVTAKGDDIGKADANEQQSLGVAAFENGDMTLQQQLAELPNVDHKAIATAEAVAGANLSEPNGEPAPAGDDGNNNITADGDGAVCSPGGTTAAVMTSCSGCGSSAAAAFTRSGAAAGASSPATPAPWTAPKSYGSPSGSRRESWAGHGTPWYPPGPNLVVRPLPPSPPREASAGKALMLAGVGVSREGSATDIAALRRSTATSHVSSGNFSGGAAATAASGASGGPRRIFSAHVSGRSAAAAVASRHMRTYGGSVALPIGRTTSTPPPPSRYTSASTRLALRDVLNHRPTAHRPMGRGGGTGTGGAATVTAAAAAGRSSVGIGALGNLDFRPRWRY
ncbi:hypothetical protein VOLCADRAFT_91439 [Volvox carteri f. nagariensis]|uniref:Uncharacterized protein n=1 Tax=Volvox carteri f. nagariensis TaxID=3068 RepID=D8TX31_VOLCA|nr:uncharacterized protein VOLCADRAFT_91439 [Volvox carteri f. nagariensis]EFJ47938.1 hypothetical protein VOLCADRAFT_91439 [Volvox carteri f. nagariensis]|eukprot:XP_002951044.1 hypothetical protein VOLCADRAFT_91439 [Volvox carteri f. nagariensis]